MQSDTWSTIKIQMGSNSSSLKDFITTWMGQSRGSSLALVDSCVGAQCNPTCPGELLFVNPGLVWGPTAQTIILSLSLVITFASLGLKIMFMLYNYLLKRKQMQYLIKTQKGLTDKEVFSRTTCFTSFFQYSQSDDNLLAIDPHYYTSANAAGGRIAIISPKKALLVKLVVMGKVNPYIHPSIQNSVQFQRF